MKFLIILALLATVSAMPAKTYVQDVPTNQAPVQVTYVSQPYSFSYSVQDDETYNDYLHTEKTDGKVTTGSYRVELPDGRTQIVSYKADENGYTAVVKYEGDAQYPDYVQKKY
ncbi:pro-resilin-like [Daphnia carinata]|uniref:pro-resilin-like n=1 Tax=Daphnia carinata TaxID=120202 RepID=UPI00257E9C44|nr:pro-resilin-like [Daphnia carinata]